MTKRGMEARERFDCRNGGGHEKESLVQCTLMFGVVERKAIDRREGKEEERDDKSGTVVFFSFFSFLFG